MSYLDERLRDPAMRLAFEQAWLADEFATQIEMQMNVAGITSRALGERIGSEPPALRQGESLTMDAMVELALALGKRISISLVAAGENRRPQKNSSPQHEEDDR